MIKKHKRLFEKYCKHKEEYDKPFPGPDDWCWSSCSDCKLRTMPFMVKHSDGEIERDICFAIWHGREGQLRIRRKKR